MQKVFLYGYWAHNLGDDLFLKIFMEHYPDTEICLVTKKRYARYYRNERITCICNDSFFYHVKNRICKILTGKGAIFLRRVRTADCAVVLGGSLFMEYKNWEKYIAKVLWDYLECTPKCYVVGSNFGPYESKEFKEAFHAIFQRMEGICFRDRYSVNIFSDLTNVHFAPDIAFNLPQMDMLLSDIMDRDYYVVSVIEAERRIGLKGYGPAYEAAILSVACELAGEGAPIILLSVCADLDDDKMAERLASALAKRQIRVKYYEYDRLEETVALLAGAKGVVATHFHTMILSFVYNVPVFPVIYNIKMENVLEDYGFEGDFCHIQNVAELDGKRVVRALKKKPDIPGKIFDMAGEIFRDTDGLLGRDIISPAFSQRAVCVCLYGNDAYTPYIGTTVWSIIKNSNPEHNYDIIVLSNGITQENEEMLRKLAEHKAWVSVRIINCERELHKFRNMRDTCFTVNIYLRFCVFTELFSKYERVITIDSDLVVNADLAALYDWDLEESAIGAVNDQYAGYVVSRKKHGNRTIGYKPMELYFKELSLDVSKYFNSGVLLFDLKKCRENHIWGKVGEVCGQYTALMYPDQDILNIIFRNDYKELPYEWNGMSPYALIHGRARMNKDEIPKEYLERVLGASIIHYPGERKPWLDKKALYAEQYMKYAEETVWKDTIRKNRQDWERKQSESAGTLLDRVFPMGSERREKATYIFYALNDLIHGWK